MRNAVRAALVVSCLLFVPGLLEQFEAPKAVAIRTLGLGALAVWLVSATGRRPFRPVSLDGAVVLWLAVEGLATAASANPRLSVAGDTQQSEGLLTSLALGGLYFATRASGTRTARGTITVGLAAVALTSLYAGVQALRLDFTPWARVATYDDAGPFVRPFGTLGHPNVLGVLTAAALAMSLAFALHARRPWGWGALAALFAAVTAATLSRGAWLGAAAGALVALALALLSADPGTRGRRALPVVAGLAALGLALAFAGFGPMLSDRFADLFQPATGSARSRIEIWRIALRAWQAHPWLGVGPDAFELTFPRFQTPAYWRFEWATIPSHAHSIYLHQLATRGVLGAAAGVALTIGWIAAAREAWRRAAEERAVVIAAAGASVAMAVAGAFGALGLCGAAWLALLSAVVASLGESPAPVPATRAKRGAQSPLRLGAWTPAAWAGGAVAITVAWFSILQLQASRAAFEGLDWAPRRAGDGDPARARAAAERAVALAPWDDVMEYDRAQTFLRLAAASADPALLSEAEASARRAIAIEPRRVVDHQALGSVFLARARLGDPQALDRAREAFDRASALAPYNALLWLQLADAEIALGRPGEALPRIRRALALYPEQEVAHRMWERASAASQAAPPG